MDLVSTGVVAKEIWKNRSRFRDQQDTYGGKLKQLFADDPAFSFEGDMNASCTLVLQGRAFLPKLGCVAGVKWFCSS